MSRYPHWIISRLLPGRAVGLTIALLALALCGPLVAPQDPSDPLGFEPTAANRPPSLSWTYLLGADARGRSVLALLLWGGRLTLAIGVGAALLAAALGALLGLLCCWRSGRLDAPVSRLMDACQAAPPLLILLLLAARLGRAPAPVMLAVFALTGWAGPARLTRAAVVTAQHALYVDAARVAGVSRARLLYAYLFPAALAPLAAWIAAGAASYVALEAGLDFLGLGLPATSTSWGTALTGAQDALASGNWWWMAAGGAALAATTLALGALSRDVARTLDPSAVRRSHPAIEEGEDAPALDALWTAERPVMVLTPRRGVRFAIGGGLAILLAGATLGGQAMRGPASPLPTAHALLLRAIRYPRTAGRAASYIATATYAATESSVHGRQIPWAAWGPCPAGFAASRCARSDVQLWYGDGQGRIQAEGSTAICTGRQTWILNPMAGLADTVTRMCGPLGPELGTLGTTAGTVQALLPRLQAGGAHVLGADVVAGRRCWLVALGVSGRLCVDAASGLALRLERLDRAGQPVAAFTITALSFGLDLAPQIFQNPIPGGHGPLVSGLTQPLIDIQVADDMALFTTLVPTWLPAGLVVQTPTFDSFYDQERGYAPQQRVRQVYTDRSGHAALELIETLPGSPWDAAPPVARARRVTRGGQHLLEWPRVGMRAAVVRRVSDGTAVLLSSHVLPLSALERVAVALQ